MRLTSGAASSSACSQARHHGRPTVSALQAALQHGLHVLMFSCIFSILDTLRLALLRIRWSTTKFATLQETGLQKLVLGSLDAMLKLSSMLWCIYY